MNYEQQQLLVKKYNLTDPDSVVVRHRGMLLQGYNVQTVASEDQLILATSASGVSPDHGRLEPMLQAAEQNLALIGVEDRPEQALADTGYWHTAQIARLRAGGLRVLVPPGNWTQGQHASPEVARMRAQLAQPDAAKQYAAANR